MAFSPRLPTFINFQTIGFQSHHKEDWVFNAHAHVAVELSVLAIITNVYLPQAELTVADFGYLFRDFGVISAKDFKIIFGFLTF